MDHQKEILKPIPRRPFILTRSSTSRSTSPPATPEADSALSDFIERSGQVANTSSPAALQADELGNSPSLSRSVLNLTSSTLLGIYSSTGYDANREEPATPWGTGAETPARQSISSDDLASFYRSSQSSKKTTRDIRLGERERLKSRGIHAPQPRVSGVSTMIARTLTLFGFGLVYGLVISRLHENQYIAPVPVENHNGVNWQYLMTWGLAGVLFGNLLPYFDSLWGEAFVRVDDEDSAREDEAPQIQTNADWSLIVRSLGAFVGIAFAIRKAPWQSTLQLSLTLALVNPVLWYLLDRSRSGFVVSFIVGLCGTVILLLVDSPLVPSPATTASNRVLATGLTKGVRHLSNSTIAGGELSSIIAEIFHNENVGVATWLASVLFCSCICFGNIGRRLASDGTGSEKASGSLVHD